jgi:hypothetical protein
MPRAVEIMFEADIYRVLRESPAPCTNVNPF